MTVKKDIKKTLDYHPEMRTAKLTWFKYEDENISSCAQTFKIPQNKILLSTHYPN